MNGLCYVHMGALGLIDIGTVCHALTFIITSDVECDMYR